MKLLSLIVISVSLALGVLSAGTAYGPRLATLQGSIVEDGKTYTLSRPTGIRITDDTGAFEPVFPPDTKLDVESLKTLQAQNSALEAHNKRAAELKDDETATAAQKKVHPLTERVYIREFSIARWDHWWLFLIGLVGLGIGAVLVRSSAKQHLESMQIRADNRDKDPLSLAKRAHSVLDGLVVRLPEIPSDAHRVEIILSELDGVKRDVLDRFVDARPILVAERGMAGYAQVMDAFAGAERMVNRSWSAAADNHLPEAARSLETARVRMEETIRRLEG